MLSRALRAQVDGSLGPNAHRTALVRRGILPAKRTITATNHSPERTLWTKKKPFDHAPWRPPSSTKGIIRFLGPTKDGNPAFLDFKKGQENGTNFGPSLEATVDVTDLREFEPPTTLATEGIEWVYAPSILSEDKLLAPNQVHVEDFIRGSYFDECAQLVKARTGASQVVAYNFRHRRIEQNTNLFDPYNFSAKPLPNFHIDNDAETAAVNLRRVLGNEEAERWLSKHWAIVNVWRPVGDVVRQWPLALVDARSLSPSGDTMPIYTRNNYKTHFSALKYSPRLRFYYVSNLAPDEALIFVDFDSVPGEEASAHGPGLGMAHGAFEDLGAPEVTPRRRSIEVRCLVLYEK